LQPTLMVASQYGYLEAAVPRIVELVNHTPLQTMQELFECLMCRNGCLAQVLFLALSVARLRRTPWFAFVVRHVSISCRRTRKFCPASGAIAFRGCSRLLSLMSKKVAEGRKLSAITPVLPTLRLWSRVEYAWHHGATLSARRR
jgi:hypothetical protein